MTPEMTAGIDVGTTKICVIAGRAERNRLAVLGTGICPSAGLRKGVIINADATAGAIRTAVKEAEAVSGCRIRSACVSISGRHISGLQSSGVTRVRGSEVLQADADRAIESATAVYMPLDREILHVVPAGFALDGQEGIINPIGMTGVRLEARVHIITGAAAAMRDLLACCGKAGIEAAGLCFDGLAASQAVLLPEEKDSGVFLVDIGGGTTSMIFFRQGCLWHASSLGVGGNHITNDIAVGLGLDISEAERVKETYGAAFSGLLDDEEEICISQSGGQGRTLKRKYLTEIIQPRCEEMLLLIKQEMQICPGYQTIVKGVVLSGGVSLLRGFDRMTEALLGLRVRTGVPRNIYGRRAAVQGPCHAAGTGLLLSGAGTGTRAELLPDTDNGVFGRVKERVKDAFRYADFINLINRKEGGVACLKSKR